MVLIWTATNRNKAEDQYNTRGGVISYLLNFCHFHLAICALIKNIMDVIIVQFTVKLFVIIQLDVQTNCVVQQPPIELVPESILMGKTDRFMKLKAYTS
jgi:hypothetical protein